MGNIKKGIHIFLADIAGHIQFIKPDGKEVMLAFDNPDFVSSFRDYFENINEEEFYSKEETIKKIKQSLTCY